MIFKILHDFFPGLKKKITFLKFHESRVEIHESQTVSIKVCQVNDLLNIIKQDS